MPKPELFNEWTGLSINLALLDELAVMVEHANSGFVQRDVEANNLTHGSLRSIVVGCEPSGESGRRPITPSHAIQWRDAAQEPTCHVSTLCGVQREQGDATTSGIGPTAWVIFPKCIAFLSRPPKGSGNFHNALPPRL